MKCPSCNQDIDNKLIASHLASIGGKKSLITMTREERVARAKKAVGSRLIVNKKNEKK